MFSQLTWMNWQGVPTQLGLPLAFPHLLRNTCGGGFASLVFDRLAMSPRWPSLSTARASIVCDVE